MRSADGDDWAQREKPATHQSGGASQRWGGGRAKSHHCEPDALHRRDGDAAPGTSHPACPLVTGWSWRKDMGGWVRHVVQRHGRWVGLEVARGTRRAVWWGALREEVCEPGELPMEVQKTQGARGLERP